MVAGGDLHLNDVGHPRLQVEKIGIIASQRLHLPLAP